jgi:hypothetical protein
MKKIITLSLIICLAQNTNHCDAINIVGPLSTAGQHVVEIVAAVPSATGNALEFIGNIKLSTMFNFFILSSIIYRYSYELYDEYVYGTEHAKKRQMRDLCVASKQLLDLVIEHVNDEVDIFGLPAQCNQAVRDLLELPGGLREFRKIVALYNKIHEPTATNIA